MKIATLRTSPQRSVRSNFSHRSSSFQVLEVEDHDHDDETSYESVREMMGNFSGSMGVPSSPGSNENSHESSTSQESTANSMEVNSSRSIDNGVAPSSSNGSFVSTASHGPPRTVVLQPDAAPYAQLCFNQKLNTLTALLVGRRYRMLSEADNEDDIMEQALADDDYEQHDRLVVAAPNLTLSSSDNDDDSGWSTGSSSSSDESSSLFVDWKQPHHQGIVWLDKQWWYRKDDYFEEQRNLRRALLGSGSSSTGSSTSMDGLDGLSHGSSTQASVGCARILRTVVLKVKHYHHRHSPTTPTRPEHASNSMAKNFGYESLGE